MINPDDGPMLAGVTLCVVALAVVAALIIWLF